MADCPACPVLLGDVQEIEMSIYTGIIPYCPLEQYLRQLRKPAEGLSGMNTAQAGDLVENLA
jgi:hypothetical protein